MTTKEYISGLIGQFLSEEDLASLVESAEFSKPNPVCCWKVSQHPMAYIFWSLAK